MLSQEIYDSWNAKTKADLKDLLDNIEGPRIPKDVQSTKFKKNVLQKLEKRRATEVRTNKRKDRQPFNNESKRCNCCLWCMCKKNSNRIMYRECKSLSYFDKICVAATETFSRSISTTKALIQKLSYWESVKKGMDGLSVIGGNIWLLSFTCQHLIDSPGQDFSMQTHIADVKETYQELGQAGELFLEAVQTFHNETFQMRTDALTILKKLTKKWAISEETNPLHVRPETMKQIPRPRKRAGAALDKAFDAEDEEDVFSVKWSPLTVIFQNEGHSARPFGRLHPQDRVLIFRKFLRSTLDKTEMGAEDLALISNQISTIELDSDSEVFSARQTTLSMLSFSKGKWVPKTLSKNDKERMVLLLNEFWYSLDVFYENVYILMRLVQETRDIIRSCYVYTDIFYKWHMPSYDVFISKSRGSSVGLNKDILHRFNPTAKKLSETASIISLMDFSSSIYQAVVQEVPVQCEGMVLRLRMNDLDSIEEPMGLVSGVDKRRSTLLNIKKPNSTRIKPRK